jgi:hypothetical protein
MGNRVVVGFQNQVDEPIIYLYQHWGNETKEALADAIAHAEGRWSDPSYATRIVISRLIGDDWSQNLGFGISVNSFAYPDYETIQVVEWESGLVTTRKTDDPKEILFSETIESFVKRFYLALA